MCAESVDAAGAGPFDPEILGAQVRVERPFPGAPWLLSGALARTYRHTVGGRSTELVIAGGAMGTSEDDVRARAVGEYVERVCGLSALRGRQLAACRESTDRRAAPEPYLRGQTLIEPIEGPGSPFRWDVGHGPADDEQPIAIPVCEPASPEPRLPPRDTTGCAAHRTVAVARLAAAREVVERDALALSWRVPGWPTARLVPDVAGDLLLGTLRVLNLAADLYCLGGPPLPPTVLAIVHTRDATGLWCGSAVKCDLEHSAVAAILEALQVSHAVQRARRDPTGGPPSASNLGNATWASSHGERVLTWYRDQASRRREPYVTRDDDLVGLCRSLTTTMGQRPRFTDITDGRFRPSGWAAARCWLPAASTPASLTATARASSRVRTGSARWAGRKSWNDDPYPFA